MKQADLGLNLTSQRTRKREFLNEMNRVVSWAELVARAAPFAPEGKKGRSPFAVAMMLRSHFMQQCFRLSEPAMEEALFDVPLYQEFAGLDNWTTRLPDESTILRFLHLLEKHKLAALMLVVINGMLRDKGLMIRAGTVVDAKLIAAPSSTKNASGTRDLEMHETKKGNQSYFGMKANIGADADVGAGAHGPGHGGQRQRRGRSQFAAALRRDRRLQGCRIPGRAQARRCAAVRRLVCGHAPGQTCGTGQMQIRQRDDR